MALFPVLELEEKIQLNDKTRLSAIKSYTSTGASPIYNVSITPGSGGTPIVLTPLGSPTPAAVEQELWYTDWQWSSWSTDIDSSNNKIDFEVGGVSYVATIASSTYTTHALLVAAIQTALNGAGSGATFTLTLDERNAITYSADIAFSLLGYTGANRFNGYLKHVNIEDDTDSSTSYTSLPVEYGLKKITLTIDDDDGVIVTPETVSVVLYQKVYTELGDSLWASDFDLQKHEDDILKWVGPGRSSFKDVHRRVQDLILEFMNGDGYVKADRNKLNKWDFTVKKDLRDWATYYALQLIFEGNSNAVDDIFGQKAGKYESAMMKARTRYISVDIDGDGKSDFDEVLRMQSINLFTR